MYNTTDMAIAMESFLAEQEAYELMDSAFEADEADGGEEKKGGFGATIKSIGSSIAGLFGKVKDFVVKKFNQFKNWVSGKLGNAKEGAKGSWAAGWNKIKGIGKNAIDSVKKVFGNAKSWAFGNEDENKKGILTRVKDQLVSAKDSVKEHAKSAWGGIKQAGKGVWNSALSILGTLKDGVVHLATSVPGVISKIFKSGKSVGAGIWNLVRTIVSTFASIITSIFKGPELVDPPEPPKTPEPPEEGTTDSWLYDLI